MIIPVIHLSHGLDIMDITAKSVVILSTSQFWKPEISDSVKELELCFAIINQLSHKPQQTEIKRYLLPF